jgi:lysophospholipase L1-like esterase
MKFRPFIARLLSLSLPVFVAAAEEAPIKVACVGDSITQGVGAVKGKSYPDQLQALLGGKYLVGNFGVSGRTLLQKGDHPYRNEVRYQKALEMLPEIVVIMLGTNDTKPQNWKFEAEFEQDWRDLVSSFQSLSSRPKVFLCRPCPVPGTGSFGINEENVLREIARLDPIAKELGCGIIDMHAALLDKPDLLPDRVHPSTEGAAVMAATAAKAISPR